MNFWDKAWCTIFCERFFKLLSSSLLLLVVTQRFDCCILQSSSGVSCSSRYGNDSPWEIILKVWQSIKQGVQEIFLERLVWSFLYPDKQVTPEEDTAGCVTTNNNKKMRTTVWKIIHKILHILGWVKGFAIFCYYEAKFGYCRHFSWEHEGDEQLLSVRCRVYPMLSECYSSTALISTVLGLPDPA